MTDLCDTRPWGNRRDFLKSSAALLTVIYAARSGLAATADIPLEFDGSNFQLKAGEPNPKHSGVVRMGIPVRPPHFDLHQSGSLKGPISATMSALRKKCSRSLRRLGPCPS